MRAVLNKFKEQKISCAEMQSLAFYGTAQIVQGNEERQGARLPSIRA